MSQKNLILVAVLGAVAVAAYFFTKKGNAGVGANGQRQLGAPPPPPPPPPAAVRQTPNAQAGAPATNWMSVAADAGGIIKGLSSIWDSLGGGEDEDGYTADY